MSVLLQKKNERHLVDYLWLRNKQYSTPLHLKETLRYLLPSHFSRKHFFKYVVSVVCHVYDVFQFALFCIVKWPATNMQRC